MRHRLRWLLVALPIALVAVVADATWQSFLGPCAPGHAALGRFQPMARNEWAVVDTCNGTVSWLYPESMNPGEWWKSVRFDPVSGTKTTVRLKETPARSLVGAETDDASVHDFLRFVQDDYPWLPPVLSFGVFVMIALVAIELRRASGSKTERSH